MPDQEERIRGAVQTETHRRYQELFIGGRWRRPDSGGYLTSVDPATEAVWAEVPDGNASDVDAAVDAARSALCGPWQRLTPAERGSLLWRLGELVAKSAQALAEVESRDNGKPIRDTLAEMLRCATWLRYFGGLADTITGSTVPLG